ncbi:MAG: DUF401 family protein [Spirochaetota bacterium]
MEQILRFPSLGKVLAALTVILLINRFTKKLALAVLVGAVTLAFWSGHSPTDAALIAWNRLSALDNIFLMGIVFQIIWLSSQMKETGVMQDLVKSVRSGLSRRFSMAALPAVIGFLPMPGGALFSAPLVDECDKVKEVHSLLKTRVNYWFRHIWEFWWPLYPGVLLTLDITSLAVWELIILQFYLSLFAILGGYLFLLRKVTSPKINTKHSSDHHFLYLVLPILVIITLYTSLMVFVPKLGYTSKYLPMVIGVLWALLVLQIQRPLGWKSWKKIIFSSRTVNLAVVVALVRIYGAYIEAPLPDGSFLVEHMRMELDQMNIPIIVMVMILPFISGVTTGLAVGFVGASFPIVISLAGAAPELGSLYSATVLAYTSGWVGMMLSPVHVCLIVTNKFFNTRIFSSMVGLIRPCLVVLAGGVGIFFLVRSI